MRKLPEIDTPVAVKNLRLRSCLAGCGKEDVIDCIKVSKATKLYVHDDMTLGFSDWTEIYPEYVSKEFIAELPYTDS